MRRSRVVSRLCIRALVLAATLCLSACASTTTTTHPAGPLPERSDFAGRITLRSPSIPTRIREYASAWRRRLMILGIESEWRFDRDMAIVDLYGVPPEDVDRTVAVLSESGGWWLGGVWLGGAAITQWRLPELDCECAAIFRIVGDIEVLRRLHERGSGGPLTRENGTEVLGG
ncbi:MAG: hypothetical protein M3Y87_32855, partial [Myxococcota bacterium]|nr:hypothetical protein [Myxococcota bacterium]